jgi:hypothetical protein
MADGIRITEGSGKLVGADECTVNSVASTYVPLGKVGFGANDVFTYVTSAVGLPVAQQGTWNVAIGAGSAAIGTVGVTALPALPAGTNVIGHVIVDAAPTTAVTGTFWQTTQPVSLAALPALAAGSNVIGHVVVDSNPTTTVTGTVAVTGTFWQSTQPVSLASLPALAAGSSVIGHVIVDTAPTTAVTIATLPALAAGTNTIGSVNAIQAGDSIEIAGTTYSVLRAFANATASGNAQVVAATAGKKVRVLKYSLTTSAAVNVYFGTSTGGTAISSTKYLAGAGSGLGASFCPFGQFADTTAGDALQINLSATANVGVDLLYVLV